ncbi:Hypothetical_protein [Hexamita inflata]|uniref:Hypothetical_protein n=1 Tax=Hexamita inflata TaxID=28002 RepID=A0AA86RPI2_9EUKA|nr:Hypothetical protein HINF_LOCUS64913 [Hexamita inflata]
MSAELERKTSKQNSQCLFGRHQSTFTKCFGGHLAGVLRTSAGGSINSIVVYVFILEISELYNSVRSHIKVQTRFTNHGVLPSALYQLGCLKRFSYQIRIDSNLNLKPNEGILLRFGKIASSEPNPLNSYFPN